MCFFLFVFCLFLFFFHRTLYIRHYLRNLGESYVCKDGNTGSTIIKISCGEKCGKLLMVMGKIKTGMSVTDWLRKQGDRLLHLNNANNLIFTSGKEN